MPLETKLSTPAVPRNTPGLRPSMPDGQRSLRPMTEAFAKRCPHFAAGLLLIVSGTLTLAAESPDVERPRTFYVEEIKAATTAYIEARMDADGLFHIHDPVTDETLALKFVKVHDPVRRIDDDTYFACTDFQVVGTPDKLYDLDFWLQPEAETLRVIDEKIHKEPRRAILYGWYKHPRYTFVDDAIVPLYED
jgi:hypothetical protein